MTKVKFVKVVSYSSEHPHHKAENLISGVASTSGSKKWKCQDEGEPRATIILQASEPIEVSSIDIGNEGSAFIEVMVRRAEQACVENSENDGFRSIIPASSFMTPLESRNEESMSRVRIFGPDKLSVDLSKQKWDQFKVVCTQPFNKRLRYGLTFLTVNAVSVQDNSAAEKVREIKTTKLGAFRLREDPDDFGLACKPPTGIFFAAKRNSDAAVDSKPTTVAAALRSEATLAEIACIEENSQKRKFDRKAIRPDLSLVTDNGENGTESGKKRKINYHNLSMGQSEQQSEERRLQLKKIVDNFVADQSKTVYEFPADLNGHDRKIVHEIADEHSLTHESVGSGKKRHVVLKKDGSSIKENTASRQGNLLPRRDVLPGERPKTPPPTTVPQKFNNSYKKGKDDSTSRQNPNTPVLLNEGPNNTKQNSPEKVKTTKSFSRLMEGVKFVISGYQNPLRAEVRQKALDMGARYSADWNDSCTHLVCAFSNTPKYNQVRKQSKNAKIVKSVWIEKCHSDRIRYPWRRHCLDPNDSGTRADESEEEIWDEKKIAPKQELSNEKLNQRVIQTAIPDDDLYDKDTDEEIEELLNESNAPSNINKNTPGDELNQDNAKNITDDTIKDGSHANDNYSEDGTKNHKIESNGNKPEEDSDDAYNAETDVDDEEMLETQLDTILQSNSSPRSNDEMPLNVLDLNKPNTSSLCLPNASNHFAGKKFILYGFFTDSESTGLKKSILSSGGTIKKLIEPQVDFMVCGEDCQDWDRNFDIALNDNRKIKFVKSKFIFECCKENKLLEPSANYIVKKY